ncbi:MAG: hypothetical protein K5656_00595 [Lachnospiraceae bacterium]|nr:hypothetical protein [Lachnospiraceae bacterium]
MNYIFGTIFMLVTVMVAVSMTVLKLLGRKCTYNNYYFAFEGAILIWCMSQLLIVLSNNTIMLSISYAIGNAGLCMVGTLWYKFVSEYTITEVRYKAFRFFWSVTLVLSVIHMLLAISNPIHHLYYGDFNITRIGYGILFYSNIVLTYLYVLLGLIVLVSYMRRTNKEGVKARTLIIASAFAPIIANVLRLTGVISAKYDITSVGFGIAAVFVLRATLVYRFLDVDYTKKLEVANVKLALSEERNRIAQNVHDTQGHTLTMLNSYIKLADISLNKGDVDDAKNYLKDASATVSSGIKELRESINSMREETEYELVTQTVMHLVNQVKEVKVSVIVKGEDSEKYSVLSKVVYDSIRESITNTHKYAEASCINIILKFNENSLDVIIGDDGKGTKKLKENNGIRGIRERVLKAGGKVNFITGVNEGFMMRISLPVPEER